MIAILCRHWALGVGRWALDVFPDSPLDLRLVEVIGLTIVWGIAFLILLGVLDCFRPERNRAGRSRSGGDASARAENFLGAGLPSGRRAKPRSKTEESKP